MPKYKTTYSIEQMAGAKGFDDSKWEGHRRQGPGGAAHRRHGSFMWYRALSPCRRNLGTFDRRCLRSRWIKVLSDDYAEVWSERDVRGRPAIRPRPQSRGTTIPKRVVLGSAVKTRRQFESRNFSASTGRSRGHGQHGPGSDRPGWNFFAGMRFGFCLPSIVKSPAFAGDAFNHAPAATSTITYSATFDAWCPTRDDVHLCRRTQRVPAPAATAARSCSTAKAPCSAVVNNLAIRIRELGKTWISRCRSLI